MYRRGPDAAESPSRAVAVGAPAHAGRTSCEEEKENMEAKETAALDGLGEELGAHARGLR